MLLDSAIASFSQRLDEGAISVGSPRSIFQAIDHVFMKVFPG
jgi:hypothetical protein